jgi:hypothetical protein
VVKAATDDGTGSTTIRLYCNLNDLEDGETYTCSVSYERFNSGNGSSVTLDWCDVSSTSFTEESGRISTTSSRSTYNSTYRFFDISIPVNASIILFDAQVEKGAEATPYVNGTRSQNTTWYDLSGNGYNVTLENQPTFNPNGYISFNGTNQRGTQSGLPSVDLTEDYYTIEVVCRFPNLPTAEIQVSGDNGGPIYGARVGSDYMLFAYAAISNESNLGVSYDDSRNNSNHRTNATIKANEWVRFTHVGIPYYDGNYWRGKFKYYVNGELDHNETVSSDSNGYSIPTTFYLGYDARWGDYGEVDIASIKRYSRELTAEEVKQNYYQGDIVTDGLVLAMDAGNLVSYESGSTTTYSLTGSIYSGSLTNGVSFSSNNGGAWDFDGSNDYIITNSPGITGTNPRTISLWFKPDVSQNKELLGYGTPSSSSMWDILLYNNNVGIHLYNSSAEAGTSYTVGEWQCVTFTYNHPTLTSYMNGVLQNSYSNSNINTGTSSKINIGRGASGYGGYDHFNGKIGPVLVYDRALSASEILQNYNAHKTRFL